MPQIAGVAQVRHSCQDKDQQGVLCGFEAICPAQSHQCILFTPFDVEHAVESHFSNATSHFEYIFRLVI